MGRVIVMTGATRGLGRAMVDRFVEEGHTVIGCGRSKEGVRELGEAYGDPHMFEVVDVTRDEEVGEWAKRVLGIYGPPELLINNAGLINGNAPLWEIGDEEFTRVVDVNLRGPANAIRHFCPAMIARNRGMIVNFSSTWGRSTSPEVAPYCATKFAVEGLTRSFSQELPSGMGVVALNPGVINTDMLQSCFGEGADAYPDAEQWSYLAVPFILSLKASDNGRSVNAT